MPSEKTRTIMITSRLSSFYLLLVALFASKCHAEGLTNVALGKTAYHAPGDRDNAYKAVDGNDNPYNPNGNWCTHTDKTIDDPWWKVDLGKNYYVRRVSIKNRGDCCAERLTNFDVRVGGPTSIGRLCHRQETSVAAGAWLHMDCPTPLPGRVVTVQIFAPNPTTNIEVLTMCEVKVMADEKVQAMGASMAAKDRSLPESIATKTLVRSKSQCALKCISWRSNKSCGMMTLCREGQAMWCLVAETRDLNQLASKIGCTTYLSD